MKRKVRTDTSICYGSKQASRTLVPPACRRLAVGQLSHEKHLHLIHSKADYTQSHPIDTSNDKIPSLTISAQSNAESHDVLQS
jgi:hypothetical protein